MVPTAPAAIPATDFGGLSEQAWDEFAGEHFYSRADWQRYCSAETQSAGSAVLANGPGAAAWAVPVRELTGLPDWSSYRWNDHLERAGLPALAPEGLLVGPPEGFQTHLLAAGDRDVDRLRGLVKRIRERCGEGDGDRAAVAMFLTTPDVRLLREAGVTHVPVLLETDAWLQIPPNGWDGYLQGFPKKRRRNIRTERERFAEAGLTITHTALGECWSTLGEPAAALLRKYGHSTTPDTELRSLRRAVDIMGPQARVALCHDPATPDQPCGFCIYYEHRGVVYIRWVGFDPARLRGAEEYFATLFYTQIERAAAAGTRWIHVGATAPVAKALRGAELRPLWMVDLSAGSPLESAADDIRSYNRSVLDDLRADRRTADALASPQDWAAFA